MALRTPSLQNDNVVAIDREIGSQYDNVKTVAENIESVVTVADHIDNVDTVATNIVDVHAVGGSIVDVRTVAANIDNVVAVGQNIANVNAVAANIDIIVTEVVPNMGEIVNSSANAAIATAKANEAATSAANALVSEQNAKASELAAGVSEDNAAASEAVAIAKAAEASASATSASNSATTATNQATIATTKASEASASEASALSSKNASALSETNAKTSETNAALSEANALAYKNSASDSATTAITQAGIATDQATIATTQAGIATTQANTATTKASEASASAIAAYNSELAAEALLDAFNDRYLGSFAVDPTTDNDGQPLLDGALYYNTVNNVLKVYDVSNVMWYTIPQVQLSTLLDVQLTSVTTGDVLAWNGSKWVNTSSVQEHITAMNNPHSVTKAQVGLGNVDNTSDINKPISTATQTELDLKANRIDVDDLFTDASNLEYDDTFTDMRVADVQAALAHLGEESKYWSNIHSAVRLFGGIIQDNGDGTVRVANGGGLFKKEASSVEGVPAGECEPMQLNAAQGGKLFYETWEATEKVQLTNNAYNYIFIVWDHTFDNGDGSFGKARVIASTNFYLQDWESEISYYNFKAAHPELTLPARRSGMLHGFTVGRVYKMDNEITIRVCGTNGWNFNKRVQLFGEEFFPVIRARGLDIQTIPNTLQFNVTEGVMWAEMANRFTVRAFEMDKGDTFTSWYQHTAETTALTLAQIQSTYPTGIANRKYDILYSSTDTKYYRLNPSNNTWGEVLDYINSKVNISTHPANLSVLETLAPTGYVNNSQGTDYVVLQLQATDSFYRYNPNAALGNRWELFGDKSTVHPYVAVAFLGDVAGMNAEYPTGFNDVINVIVGCADGMYYEYSGVSGQSGWKRVQGYIERNGWLRFYKQSAVDALRYNDSTNNKLVDLENGMYGVAWIYMVHDNSCHVVYGQGAYTSEEAKQAALPSPLPGILAAYSTLVGKMTFSRGATTFENAESPFIEKFISSGVSLHNDLAGLDGGNSTQNRYYHLDEPAYNLVNTFADVVDVSPEGDLAIVGDYSGANALFSGNLTVGGTTSGITKTMVGLANAENTADSAKNVLSATKLTTARTINGVSFDGTADITVADSTKVSKVSSTDNAIVRFDGTSGAVQNSSVVIDDSGNVGIGISSPSYKLQVSGNFICTYAQVANGTTNEFIGLSLTNAYTGGEGISFLDSQGRNSVTDSALFFGHQADYGSNIRLYTQPAGTNTDRRVERMRIDSSGNVGIGTSSPTPSGGAAKNLTVYSPYDCELMSKGAGAWLTTHSTNTSGYGWGGWRHIDSNGIKKAYVYTAGNSAISFGTEDTERMRINSSGNVLIGKTTDNGLGKLQVNGTMVDNDIGNTIYISIGNKSVTANVENYLINLSDTVSQTGQGVYIIDVFMDGNGSDGYWWSHHTGTIPLITGAGTYNSAPSELINMTHHYHHRATNSHNFYLNSMGNLGDYGTLGLYVVPATSGTAYNIQIRLKKLFTI